MCVYANCEPEWVSTTEMVAICYIAINVLSLMINIAMHAWYFRLQVELLGYKIDSLNQHSNKLAS